MQNKTRTRHPVSNIELPSKTCEDQTCPFHGNLKVRGKTFEGVVVSDKMQKSIIVSWEGRKFVPKFERYTKTKTKISAHNPSCIDAKEGDLVLIQECRPISKTKSFVVLKVLGEKDSYILEKNLEQEGKHKLKKKEIANIDAEKAESEKTEKETTNRD